MIEGEFIATTPTHLFYTTEGWVEAGELGEDAYVVRAGGAPGQVWESLTFTLPRQMYDLTVAEAHTFFVGEEQWLVHNCGGNYSVYQSVGTDDNVQYVGMTNNPARRGNEHRTGPHGMQIEVIPNMTNLSLTDARNVEQALIDHYTLPELINQRNSISPRRSDFADRLARGYQLLNDAGYFDNE